MSLVKVIARPDAFVSRLFANAGTLLAGSVGASLLGLVSLSLTARGLGVEQFGVLVLITTYVLVVDRLVNFQSWQAIIRYGVGLLASKKKQELRILLKFGFMLDAGSALIGSILASSGVWLIGNWQDWDSQHVSMAILYSFTIFFHLSGTPTAVLRLFGKFRKLALQQVLASGIKLLGVTFAYFSGATLWVFLAVWAIADVLGNLLLLSLAARELKANDVNGVLKAKVRRLSTRFQGIWSFVWTTNIHSAVKLGLKDMDVLVISYFLGSSGAGLYKIVKSIGATFGRATDPLYQAVYPDLSRAVHERDSKAIVSYILEPIKYIGILVGVGLIGFYFVGDKVLGFVLGPEFLQAYHPALMYMVGVSIAMLTFSFQPTMLALGRAVASLNVLVLSTLVYFIALYYLTERFGLVGAASAYVIFYLVWSFVQFQLIRSTFQESRK